MKDKNGQAIPGSLYESDGIHPNKDTMRTIISYFRTHALLS